jgi:hypothetical protein
MMFTLVAGLLYACSKDDNKEEPKKPLATPYIEFAAAEDANLIFTGGEAADKTVTLKANRELEATASTNWVTTTVTVNADKSVSLKIAVQQSNATKKRTATVTVTTKPAEEGDKTATPITISLSQGVFGLPTADLLDLVFIEGEGPNLARDISPLANPVLDVPTYSEEKDGTVTEKCPKVYPTISANTTYGRNVAYFKGASQTCIDAGARSDRTSCSYRIDFVDYSTALTHYHPNDLASNTVIPLNDLGKGLDGGFSMEAIIKRDPGKGGNFFSATQSYGFSLGVSVLDDDHGRLDFYMDTNNDSDGRGTSGKTISVRSADPAEEGGPKGPAIESGKYYHIVGTYDKAGEKLTLYVDGVKVNEGLLEPGYRVRFAQPKTTDALAQWICLGADARRADPYINGQYVHLSDNYENWSEYSYTGEVVIARIYSKALSDAEVKTLYDYEKPE